MRTGPTALCIEYWPIERLVDYPRNPRKNDAAVDRMGTSILEFGFAIPVLARSSGEVIDGHLRLKAARALGKALARAHDPLAARVSPLAWGWTAALVGTIASNAFYLTIQFYYFYVFLALALAVPLVFGSKRSMSAAGSALPAAT